KRVVKSEDLKRDEQRLNERIDAWLNELDEADHDEAHRDKPHHDQRRRLLVRGFRKGRRVISLAVLAYNLKRLMNHIGTEALKARLKAMPA
ncbi:hypothetical protein, partial [Chromohalobacter sp. 296-RDG]|uniref:hypothetical protein n=1 Tax=Chromohalobacter sp. 296-RDG TaxID=2994062 RepID=UPI0024686458